MTIDEARCILLLAGVEFYPYDKTAVAEMYDAYITSHLDDTEHCSVFTFISECGYYGICCNLYGRAVLLEDTGEWAHDRYSAWVATEPAAAQFEVVYVG